MIDREARRQVAELLRHYLAGLITNDEFEDRLPRRSSDPAVSKVALASWFLYDDNRKPYKLVGRDAPSRELRSVVGRWIVFLGTDFEYEHPVPHPIVSLAFDLASLCTFGVLGWAWRRRHRAEFQYWPFIRQSDYERALDRPTLLATEG